MWNKLFRSRSASKLKDITVENENGCVVRNKTKLSSAFKSFRRKSKDRSHNESGRNGDTVTERLEDVYRKASTDSHDMHEVRSHTASPDYDPPIKSPAHNSNNNNNTTTSCFAIADIPAPPSLPLQECPICARTFVPETLAKHIGICEKMATKKRKIFDSSRQRREGTDMAQYLPKNFGLPQKQSTVSPAVSAQRVSEPVKSSTPKTITQRKSEPASTPFSDRRDSSLSKSNHSLTRETPRPVRRVSAPTNEKCPHCDRTFGMKAFDRHVEWCKEKSLICKNNNSNMTSAAKERLEARTKYRAPNLKAKRQTVRDKYGSLSCSGSTSSLADIGTPTSAMTTSLTSDTGLFDRYDPFLSAKRQLEELYSPPGAAANTSASMAKKTPSPQANNTDPKVRSNSISNSNPSSGASFKRGEISNLSTARSSFRRTASLRMPNKLAKPLFAQAMKPTIQRGISDEGPISPNFLKSAEYDELPVRTAFNAIQTVRSSPPKEIHRPVLRDTRSVVNRKQNLNLELRSPSVMGAPAYPISKTDSLAVFLKYETEVDVEPPPAVTSPSPVMTEKDLKDKSNNMNKRSSMPKEDATADSEKFDAQKFPDIFSPIVPMNLSSFTAGTPKLGSIKLDPICRNNKNTLTNMLFDSKREEPSNDFIHPKLINLCDNLNVTKLSSDSASDTSSGGDQPPLANNAFEQKRDEGTDDHLRPMSRLSMTSEGQQSQQQEPAERPLSLYKHQNSIDRRSTLSRQRKLNKDNILFDTTPESDLYSDTCDKAISHVDSMESLNTKKFDDATSMFDDFDLEEFISTFDDDERFPIFKDYKNILLSRALSNTSTNSNTLLRSDRKNPNNPENDRESSPVPHDNRRENGSDDQFSKEPTPESESEMTKSNNDFNSQFMDDLSPAEKELLKSVQELDQMTIGCGPVDSDEVSSIEGYPLTRQAVSKLSADSAYGSLSRQSPSSERPSNATRHLNKQRQQLQQLHHPLFGGDADAKRPSTRIIRENTSLSSSGSESSLPPIIPNLRSQKMELHPHADKNVAMAPLSKFCHECGSKYIVAQAKFCMECGVRRLAV